MSSKAAFFISSLRETMLKISSDFDDSFSVVRLLKHSLELFCVNFDLRFKFTNRPLFDQSEADSMLNHKSIAPLKNTTSSFSSDFQKRISELEEKGWLVSLFIVNFREYEESLNHNFSLALGIDLNLKDRLVKDHLFAYPCVLKATQRESLVKMSEDVKNGEYGFISNSLSIQMIENHQFHREHLIYAFVNDSLVFAMQKRIEKIIAVKKVEIEQNTITRTPSSSERQSVRRSQRKSLGTVKSPIEIEKAVQVELRMANEVFESVVRILKMREFG